MLETLQFTLLGFKSGALIIAYNYHNENCKGNTHEYQFLSTALFLLNHLLIIIDTSIIIQWNLSKADTIGTTK